MEYIYFSVYAYFVLRYTTKGNVYPGNVYSAATENNEKKMHFVAIYSF